MSWLLANEWPESSRGPVGGSFSLPTGPRKLSSAKKLTDGSRGSRPQVDCQAGVSPVRLRILQALAWSRHREMQLGSRGHRSWMLASGSGGTSETRSALRADARLSYRLRRLGLR